MRWILLPLLLAGVVVGNPPKPKAPALIVSKNTSIAGTVYVKYTYSAAGSPDSIVIVTTGPSTVRRKYFASARSDSVAYTNLAPGQTVSGTVTATAYRRGLSASSAPAPWSHSEPDQPPPAPTVTVEVLPAAFTIQSNQTQTLIARIRTQ